LHPGSSILIYLLAALVIPGLSFFPLAILTLAALPAIARMGRRPLRLIWRTRWLMLVLILGYGYGVPGEGVLAWLGPWTPTWPGLAQGGERAFHLMVLLLWLDVLVLRLSSERLLSGLHALMSPLAPLGLDAGRIALRLALTLKAIERLEQRLNPGIDAGAGRGPGPLRHLFDPVPGADLPEQVVLTHHRLGVGDVAIPLLLLAGFGLLAWSGAWR
jgi:energy-coupling factor transport system permease protein